MLKHTFIKNFKKFSLKIEIDIIGTCPKFPKNPPMDKGLVGDTIVWVGWVWCGACCSALITIVPAPSAHECNYHLPNVHDVNFRGGYSNVVDGRS